MQQFLHYLEGIVQALISGMSLMICILSPVRLTVNPATYVAYYHISSKSLILFHTCEVCVIILTKDITYCRILMTDVFFIEGAYAQCIGISCSNESLVQMTFFTWPAMYMPPGIVEYLLAEYMHSVYTEREIHLYEMWYIYPNYYIHLASTLHKIYKGLI